VHHNLPKNIDLLSLYLTGNNESDDVMNTLAWKDDCKCDSPCQSMNYETSFSFLKTSENDIHKMDKAIVTKIMNDNQKALDYRINTDKDLYLKFLSPIKDFKRASKFIKKVYGQAFVEEIGKKGKSLENELGSCRQSLIKAKEYYKKLRKFYSDFFSGPAELHLPDVSEGTRSLIRNIETAMDSPLDKEFKKMVEFQIKSTRIALTDSKNALVEIFDLYGNYTPILPNATDYNSSMGVNELYLTKPLTDVGNERSKKIPDYNIVADASINLMGKLLTWLSKDDKNSFNDKKDTFIDDMTMLGKKRRDLMSNTFLKPFLDADWREETLGKCEIEVAAIMNTMVNDLNEDHFNYTDNGIYDAWVASMKENGFLNVSVYAKQARESDTWSEKQRFPSIVFSIREYLTETYARFSRLETNFLMFQQKVDAVIKMVEKEIKEWVEPNKLTDANSLLYGSNNLNVYACLNLLEKPSQKPIWDSYFKTTKKSIKDVMDIFVPKFEKLKYVLDAHAEKLQPSGTFYR
jgi:hypothetical protein